MGKNRSEDYQKGYVQGAAEMGRRFKNTIQEMVSIVKLIIDAMPSTEESIEMLRNNVERIALEVAKLIDDDINRDLILQEAFKILTGTCASCPAEDVCNQHQLKTDIECLRICREFLQSEAERKTVK